MDYARFNHVAQPGDYERGVSMMPPRMGLYDEYAVKWLYTYLPNAKTPEEEQPWLDNLVRSHADDPIYRYGKQQIFNTLDPTSLSEDLGDDHVRASEYGIRNLKYIMKHLNEWYGEDDNDLTAREAMYKYLLNQYLTYINHVYNVKGGMIMNERKAGDPRPSYSFVDGDYQRRAQKFLIDQLHDLDWLDDSALLKELPLQGNLSVRVQRILVSCIEADKGSFGRMIDPAPNAYTQLEHADDAMKGIFRHTYQGKSLTPRDRSNQNSYVDMLLMITRLAPKKSSEKGIADDERGIGFAPQLDPNGWNISTGNVYAEALGDGDHDVAHGAPAGGRPVRHVQQPRGDRRLRLFPLADRIALAARRHVLRPPAQSPRPAAPEALHGRPGHAQPLRTAAPPYRRRFRVI